MKTILISILTILVLGNTNAKPIRDIISIKEPSLQTEEYINDIPFNTELIAGESLMMRDGWETRDEANVNDIPFDTRKIANEILLDQIVNAYKEEEINDIPFNTRKVYEECMMARLMHEYKNEISAHDIKFDTEGIAASELMAAVTDQYRNEVEICDIPYETVCIISTSYDRRPAYVVLKKKYTKKAEHRKKVSSGYEYTIIQPRSIEYSAPVPSINTLTRDLMATPGSSL